MNIHWNKAVIDIAVGLLTLFGGCAAFLKYLWGRIYVLRLAPSVEARFVVIGGVKHIEASCELRNAGNWVAHLRPEDTRLRVSVVQSDVDDTHVAPVDYSFDTTQKVFQKHDRIESGEVIYDTFLATLPLSAALAYKCELHVASTERRWVWSWRRRPEREQRKWIANCLVIEENPVQGR